MMDRWNGTFVCSAIAAICCAAVTVGRAAEPVQGLTVTFETLAPAAAPPAFVDTRLARLVALYVPARAAPSVFTPAGPFRATFKGDINVRLRTYVRFHAEGRGTLALSVNGKSALAASGDDLSKSASQEVRLNKGHNHLIAIYESPGSGDAQVRLFWSAQQWLAEPVPPMAFTQPAPDADAARSLAAREGRFLFAQMRCARCHADEALIGHKETMPELGMDAPSLSGAGARFNADWMAAWIDNPRALRPDSHMPRLLNSGQGGINPRARDVAAYLASLASPPPRSVSVGNPAEGGRVFANLDCVACHAPPGGRDDPAQVSLKFVKAKYKSAALLAYLLDPAAHYAWDPMPNFHLSAREAGDLTAFLLSTDGGKVEHGVGSDAAAGKRLVASAGCLDCHQIGNDTSASKAPALAAITNQSLKKGCLAAGAAARGRAPEFSLTVDQRSSLVAFLETDRASLARRSAPEFAERQIAALRCAACHARDGSESLLSQGLDAEAQALRQEYPNPPPRPDELFAADQRPPMLTWAGAKLRPRWMADFIAGRIPYKPRYYLRARMPSFAARADQLAAGLAAEQGCPPVLPPEPGPDPRLAEAGRNLGGRRPNVGFSCVQCHAVQDQPPFSPFEAPSINFKYVADRLRHDYYTRWMHDPLRIDPNSKMPRFDDADGKTGLAAFNGDARRQFDAIWQYLLEGERIQPPS